MTGSLKEERDVCEGFSEGSLSNAMGGEEGWVGVVKERC